MSRVATALARRISALPPMTVLNTVGYVLGGIATIASRTLYRPEGQVWILVLGIGLMIFGATMPLYSGRASPMRLVYQGLFMLTLLGVCGLNARDGRTTIAIAAALGALLIYPATRVPTRYAVLLMALASAESSVLVMASGLTGSARTVLAIATAALSLVPTLTVISYRRQLEAALSRLAEAATTDALTGLVNRRGLADQAPILFSEAERMSGSVAVLLADIDHFKRYNDTYGHLRGDDVLRTVARLMRATVRPADLVARLGGEELCIVTVLRDPADVVTLAERVRGTVELYSDAVTISLGVAMCRPRRGVEVDEQLWEMIDTADALLYEAKQAGRNTVRVERRPPTVALQGSTS